MADNAIKADGHCDTNIQISTGIIHFPGATAASKAEAEKWLWKDHVENHCFFNARGLHNHLSHHVLAAFDLGAPPHLIKAARDYKQRLQRPIKLGNDANIMAPGDINVNNWMEHLGEAQAYLAYLTFFEHQIAQIGVECTLQSFVFDDVAFNRPTLMLVRLVSGAFHPMIQLGYGLEFNSPPLIAQGLAQAACHAQFLPMHDLYQSSSLSPVSPSNRIQDIHIRKIPPQARHSTCGGPSVLELIRKCYDDDRFTPIPYSKDENVILILAKTLKKEGVSQAIQELADEWHLPDTMTEEDIKSKTEELIHFSALLLFATGRAGKKPRLDFFLMHLVTGALFIPSVFKVVHNTRNRAHVLRYYLTSAIAVSLFRGRPKIDCDLVMSYPEFPAAPGRLPIPRSIVPDTAPEGEHINPWPMLIQSVLLAPDSHTIKTLRTLIYANREYGLAPAGSMIGAFDRRTGEETLKGAGRVDGTLWVRCAGVLADTMGWIAEGDIAPPDWDRTGLGWDEAWNHEPANTGVPDG